MNMLVVLAVLLTALPAPAQDKAPAKTSEPEKAKPAPAQDPVQEKRDPTESDLPRPNYAPHVPVPAIALRAIVIAADRPGAAILSIDGRNCRVQKGDTLTLGAIPAVVPSSAPAGGYSYGSAPAPRRTEGRAPTPAARATAPGVIGALHIVSLTADELRIEVIPSGEIIVVR